MGLASSILWIVAGIIYIIYQGLKADAASTIVILGVAIAIPAGGLVIYGIDKLLKLIHPLFAGAFWCTAIIVGYLLYLKWWYREKHKRDAEWAALQQEQAERIAREEKMMESGEYTEEFIDTLVKRYISYIEINCLKSALHREPTEEEIRKKAIERAEIHYRAKKKRELEEAAQKAAVH